MIQKIKSYLLIVTSLLTMGAPLVLAPVAAYAAEDCNTNIQNNIASGANGAAGPSNGAQVDCTGAGGDPTGRIGNLAQKIVNIFSYIVGAIAIIMIIYGGFRYITSGGDSGRVGSAKNTIIYAIIGLVIVALAQIIVRLVLNQTNTVAT